MLLSLITSALVLPGWVNLVLTILPILGFLGALFGWYTTYQKGKREKTQEEEAKLQRERDQATELEARKQAYAQFQGKVEERFLGINQAMERMGEHFTSKYTLLEKETSQIPALRDLLGRLETKMEMNGKTTERMEGKLDRFLENFHKP